MAIFFFFFFLNYTTSGSNCLIKGHRAWRVTHLLKLERPCQQTCTPRVVSFSGNSTLKEKWQRQKGQGRKSEGKDLLPDLQDPSCSLTHVPLFVQTRAHGKMSVPTLRAGSTPQARQQDSRASCDLDDTFQVRDDTTHREMTK